MSPLQIGLFSIAILVIGIIFLYNRFQERQLLKRQKQGLSAEPVDSPDTAEFSDRVEPQIHSPVAQMVTSEASPGDFSHIVGMDESIDCVAKIRSDRILPTVDVKQLFAAVATCGRHWRAAGLNAATSQWEPINNRGFTGQFTQLQLALPLANRSGVITSVQLSSFFDAVSASAKKMEADFEYPPINEVLQQARELEEFCAQVDVVFGINVVASSDSEPFTGLRLRALAESAGFTLQPDGIFYLLDEDQNTILSISNQEETPFLQEQINALSTQGISILLDLPKVSNPQQSLERMFEVGKSFSVALKARLVDDNRAALNASSMQSIREQLIQIETLMVEKSILPGSERALRLFY